MKIMERRCTHRGVPGEPGYQVACGATYAPAKVDVSMWSGCSGVTVTRTARTTYTATTILPVHACVVRFFDPTTRDGSRGNAMPQAWIGVEPLPGAMPSRRSWPNCTSSSTAISGDMMTYPPPSAVVPAAIGRITVPRVSGVVGATLQLRSDAGTIVKGGIFAASGPARLTAVVPRLHLYTTYTAFAVGVPCGPTIGFGGFSTHAGPIAMPRATPKR